MRQTASNQFRFRAVLLIAVGALLGSVTMVVGAPAVSAETPFTVRLATQIIGDVQMTGNAVLTCPAGDSVCVQALNPALSN